MTTAEPMVLVAVTQMVVRTGTSLGIDRAQLLADAGLDETELIDRDAYVPLGRMVALGEAIERRRPNVNIGLAALEFVSPATFGALGYIIGHSANLGAALEAFARYQNLLSPAVRWELQDYVGVRIRLHVAPPLQRLRFPLETQVGLWVDVGRQLSGVDWSPRRVRFAHHPRGPAEEFEALFACPVEFGAADNELELPPAVLELPVLGARPELQPSLTRLVQALLPAAPAPAGVCDRVRALLLEELPRGVTSRDEVARRLGVSPRTLTRRLQAEDVSFRELLAEVREQLACAWLRDPALGIHEVAYLLGYSEPSTFHRSFRRWTGQTPTDWRRAST